MNEIYIKDDFDLEKIRTSGQCFRVRKLDRNQGDDPQTYSLIFRDHYLELHKSNYIKETSELGQRYQISCSESEWDSIWSNYFDLQTNYADIRKEHYKDNDFTDICMNFGTGLRILRQDPWEMLITFIISQRRSMPAIASAVDKICNMFGDTITTRDTISSIETTYKLFPTPEQLANAKTAEIAKAGVGYRVEYIKCAAEMVSSGELDLVKLGILDDDKLYSELCRVKGVGTKVANCVMLFGYHRVGRAPVDVWIERVINQDFNGVNPFPKYGDVAGIIQQYFFYYKTQTRNNKRM